MSYLDLSSSRCRFLCSGPDALRYLNGQVTQDLRLLQPGRAMPACVTNAKGKLEAELMIAADPRGFLLDGPGELRDFLALRLEKYLIADDCHIEDVTDAVAQFHLLSAQVAPGGLPASASVVFASRHGSMGIDIRVPIVDRDGLRAVLPGGPADPVALDDARILRGIPLWGRELDASTLPPEAGLDRTHVSYSKGCYIGQEVISRLKSVGQVTRRLCVLRANDGQLLPGMDLADAPSPGSKPIGAITSVSSCGRFALAMVRRAHSAPGSHLYALPKDGSALSLAVEILEPTQPPPEP